MRQITRKHKGLAQKNAQCGMFWVKSTPSAFHFWGPWKQKNAKAKTCKTTSLKGFVNTAGALLKVQYVKFLSPVFKAPAAGLSKFKLFTRTRSSTLTASSCSLGKTTEEEAGTGADAKEISVF